jgi:2-polyprenyl-3-methyl-5-hydroxy-6-metoxy-1,4-benzoquinol methylase
VISPTAPVPVCPCCSVGSGDIALSFDYAGVAYRLRRCAHCASIYYDPPPAMDYRTHTAGEHALRDYVEMNCSVDTLAANLMGGIAGMPAGRLLDVGCGYGFAADIARRVAGWQVLGVEPSTYGRRGAAELHLDILADFVGPGHPLEKERFDAVFASEVLEHVEEPAKFVAFFVGLLKPGGRLVLSTPDAAVLYEGRSESERLAALSPGAHVALFSRKALVRLLHAAGLRHVTVRRQGASFFVVASSEPIAAHRVDGIAVATEYIEKLFAARADLPDALAAGLRYRLFRYLIDLGRLSEAAAIEPMVDWPARVDLPVATYAAYLDAYRTFAPWALMYRGFLHSRHYRDHRAAAGYLADAHTLAATRIRIGPNAAVSESSVVWRCLLDAGREYRLAGDDAAARQIFTRVVAASSAAEPDGLPPVPDDIRVAAVAEISPRRRWLWG